MSIEDWPLAYIAVDPGQDGEKIVPVRDRLFVGRECSGVDEHRRLLIDDETVSRNHLEIRLDPERNEACVVDTSTNGTRLNGIRIERATPVTLRPGDRIAVAGRTLEFRSDRFTSEAAVDSKQTVRRVNLAPMALVVGDILNYSTISQYTDAGTVLSSLEVLYGDLRKLLSRHRGTLNNYVGDAFFAVWDVDENPDAAHQALSFALEAVDLVRDIAPGLALRDPSGDPIRMGWAVVQGSAAVSAMTGMLVAVLGDATNLAFRLSGLSAREGRAEILATRTVLDVVGADFAFGPPEDVSVKGRSGTETVFPVMGRVATPHRA